jgi:serine/threonine-protein kinase
VIGAEVGTQFGQYTIEEFIGRGGMGVVYRAEHAHLGRKVALKMLAPELAENESFRERFVRESRLAASIDHPNVIPIYEAAEIEGHYFIAMRYVEGVDLKAVIASEGPLPVERALAYIGQLAGALDAAHARDLVHRDVKPGNVLVTAGSEHCYLTDFGLTKTISGSTGFTATGQFVGTTDYCAPEQIEGKPLDRRTDVYSLACVFFECLTGHPPFRRDTDMATMWAHIQEPPPSIAHERRDMPESLDTVLATAMAKRKDDRYPTCSSFAAAAVAALEMATGRSYAGSITRPKPAPAGPTDEAPRAPASAAPPPELPPTAPLVVSNSFTRPEDIPSAAPPQYAPPPQYVAAPAGWQPMPYDSQPTAVQRQRPVTAIALIVAALLVGGGGTAAALIVTKNKEPKQTAAAQPAAPTPDRSGSAPAVTPRQPVETPAPVKPKPHKTPAPTPTPTPGPIGSSGAGDAAAVEAAADGHWAAIASHDFNAAYGYFSSSTPFSRSSWIASHQRDKITSVDANWTAGPVHGNAATARVVSLQTVSRNGCQDWSGYYDMVKEGGEWKIADSHLSDSSCG